MSQTSPGAATHTAAAPHKIIYDTVHGSLRFDGLFFELLDTPELQKLHNIRQLGFAYLVFPGANHTRIEHSMGAWHIAGQMAGALELDAHESLLVRAAALLHDVGHGPYSHTLEYILHSKLDIDHMAVTKGIITGEYEVLKESEAEVFADEARVPALLERYDLDPYEVAALITGEEDGGGVNGPSTKRYLPQIIHSAIDCDQIDYLLRDAYNTGVAWGTIDAHRLEKTLLRHNDELVVDKSGITAVEGMLVARALMYSSVYFHHTVRIAEQMLARAVERVMDREMLDIQRLIDSELMEMLKGYGGYPREIALRLQYRQLYKQVEVVPLSELDKSERVALLEISDWESRSAIEREVCTHAGVPDGTVIIDTPAKELLLSEPRIHKTDVQIYDDGRVRPLSKLSPLARALEQRQVSDWALMVAAPPKYHADIAGVTRKMIFG